MPGTGTECRTEYPSVDTGPKSITMEALGTENRRILVPTHHYCIVLSGMTTVAASIQELFLIAQQFTDLREQ